MCRNRVLLRSFDYRQTSIHETIEEIGSINMDDVVDTGSANETTEENLPVALVPNPRNASR